MFLVIGSGRLRARSGERLFAVQMSQKMVESLRRALLGTFEDSFVAWVEFTASQSHMRGLHRKASSFHKSRALRKAMDGWTNAAGEALHRKRTASKLVGKMER